MAKKNKSSMALFEVVSRTKDKTRKAPLAVPDWMKPPADDTVGPDGLPEPPPTPEPPADAATDSAVEADESGADTAVERSPAAPVGADRPEAPDETSGADAQHDEPDGSDASAGTAGEAALSVAGGRLTVSLNYVSCAVVGMAVVFGLLVAFALGRLSVDRTPPAAEPAEPANGSRAGLDVGAGPDRSGLEGPVRPRRISGKHYLVIRQMGGRTPAHKAAAEKIVAYCQAVRNDLATVVDDGQQYAVLSGKPFDSGTSNKALEYAVDIHGLGIRYKTDEKSKYDFNQLDRQGNLDPWFVTEP